MRVASCDGYAKWDVGEIQVSDKFKEFPVGVYSIHMDLLDHISSLAYEGEIVGQRLVGGDRCLQSGGRTDEGLAMYPK